MYEKDNVANLVKNEEAINQSEHDEVVWYVLKRPLYRPDTSYKRAACFIMLFLIVNIAIISFLYFIVLRFNILSMLPRGIEDLHDNHRLAFIVLLSLIELIVGIIFMSKQAIIGAIHLYQRYASEDLRRRCLCKPTCSEYAIQVIEKYGVIRGLRKSYVRLFKTCRGRRYKIDNP